MGPPAVGLGFIPRACTGFFRTHSLGKDTFLSLDIVGWDLVLSQSDVVDFVDSPWDALSSLRNGLGVVEKVERVGGG